MKIQKIEKKQRWASVKDLKEGDLIWTFNLKTKTKELKPIKKIIIKNDNKFIKIVSDNYEQIVTEDHNVLLNDCSFKKAKDVKVGDILINNKKVEQIVKFTTENKPVWCVNTENNTVYASKNFKEFLTGNSQSPFSNITLDLTPPDDLLEEYPNIAGKKQPFKYKELQAEMDRFNSILFDVFEQGDSSGGMFQYPIITINVTPEFRWDHPVSEKLFRITTRFGIPYFSNFINTGFSTSEIRSMCVSAESLIEIEFDEDCIEHDKKFYALKEFEEIKNKAIHKKGSVIVTEIQKIAESNIKYKVKTSKSFETPHGVEKHAYNGPMLTIILEKDIVAYSCIPEHECLVFKSKLIEKKAKDLETGDVFVDSNNNHHKIKVVTTSDYSGTVYSFVMPSRNYYVNNYLTKNCCRLRLDLRELSRRGGALFGSAENTGSIGVVTLNLPKIGFLAKSEEDFFQRLDALMITAKNSLEIKRKKLTKWFEEGLYPYTKRYLSAGYVNHFSTIGIVGMNECCLNFLKKDIKSIVGKEFAEKVLDYMRNRCSDFQVETGTLYNLESTPAESASYRLALHDLRKYPDIITAGTKTNPYYTNSSNLPVSATEDPWKAIKHQESLQKKFTGGTTFHCYLGQAVDDWTKVRDFIKKVMTHTELPYLTISPTFSHCQKHGYIPGDTNGICPKCQAEQREQYNKKLVELKEKRDAILGKRDDT